MPPKKRIDLSNDAKVLLVERLQRSQQALEAAEETLYLDVYTSSVAGMTIDGISQALGKSQGTVVTWKRKGEQARDRRLGQDPGGPSERGQDG